MNNKSIGLNGNETFFGNKESMISEGNTISNDGNTKISDVSREFRELNREIFKTIQSNGDASGISNNNNNNNNNSNSIGILLDNTWVNQKESKDNSENFQAKMNEFKKKSKTPTSNKIQQSKHIITYINNPQKGAQQFKMTNKKTEADYVNTEDTNNYNIMKKHNAQDDDHLTTDDIPNTTEEINKLNINSVKKNNLNELNGRINNYNDINNLNKTISNNDIYNYNEEFSHSDNFTSRDLSKKTLNPKFMERTNNPSTRFSTNESNESFDLGNNKLNNFDEKLLTHTASFNYKNYPHTPVMQYPGGKKINFTPSNHAIATKSTSVCIPSNVVYNNPIKSFPDNNINNYFIGNPNNNLYSKNQYQYNNLINQVNINNFPENAFSYNIDPFINNKNYSDKKKIKKSKDEVDQTLFIINIENIIYGRDKRTTIMIRHIPNKYSSQSLLEEINDFFKGKFDFFYLPMDFENNCNLGYAFINFVDHLHIIHFYDTFKARKWKQYKSHKECDLSYAKFQGKLELTSHLEKSCIMNKISEDKKPIILIINEPYPKIEIPSNYAEIFKTVYPHLVHKFLFLK